MGKIACPACGFLVLEEEFYGSYDICPICGWEDDGVQLANPCSGGGANGESLHECQQQILKQYPLGIGEASGFTRDSEWRPLTEEEVSRYEERRKQSHWNEKAILEPASAYWKRAA